MSRLPEELKIREISPFEDLEIPFYSQPGVTMPMEVVEANRKAELHINAEKDKWLLECLKTIFSPEDVGEIELQHLDDPQKQFAALLGKLDPSQLSLVRRPEPSVMIAAPSISPEADTASKKQKVAFRHSSDTLTLTYKDITTGQMVITYNHDGTIALSFCLRDNPIGA